MLFHQRRAMEKRYLPNSTELINHELVAPVVKRLRNMVPKLHRGFQLNIDQWREGLKDHPQREYVEEVLRRNTDSPEGGWQIAEETPTFHCNAQYRITAKEAVAGLEKMEKMLKNGYMLGPFAEERGEDQYPEHFFDEDGKLVTAYAPLFFKLEYRPSMSGAMKEKYRLLSDFSNDHDGPSFNDQIPAEEKSVRYITLLEIINWIMDNDLQWLWAIDAQDAYYRMPVQQHMIRLMGAKLAGLSFHFTCLVMGISTACRLYTEFAEVVKWIIMNNHKDLFLWRAQNREGGHDTIVKLLVSYIDDFLGGAHTKEQAMKQLEATKKWWELLGIPSQIDKETGVNRWVNYIGFLINAHDHTLGPRPERLEKYRAALKAINHQYYKRGKKIRVKDLMKIVGQFRSIQCCFPYMIPFLRRLEESIAEKARFHYTGWCRITAEMIEDVEVVRTAVFAAHERMAFKWFTRYKFREEADVEIFTDAATSVGVGGFIKGPKGANFHFYWDSIPNWNVMAHPDITFMELMGVVMAVKLWGSRFEGMAVKLWCDNWAAVAMGARKVACFLRRDLNALLRELCTTAMKERFYFYVQHIPGKDNVIADALSRNIEVTEEDLKRRGTGLAENPTMCTEEAMRLMAKWTSNAHSIQQGRHRARCDCGTDINGRRDRTGILICRKTMEAVDAVQKRWLARKQPNAQERRLEQRRKARAT